VKGSSFRSTLLIFIKGSDLLLVHLKNIIEKNEGIKSLFDSFDFLTGLQVCF